MIDVIVIHVAVKVARVIVLNVARASYVFLKKNYMKTILFDGLKQIRLMLKILLFEVRKSFKVFLVKMYLSLMLGLVA